MIFLTKDTDLILNKIQVLYFYSTWMPYHKKMLIMLNKVKEKYSELEYIAIDTDYYKILCSRFSVTSIPTVLMLHDGKEVGRINGLVLTSAFKSTFSDIYNSIGENNAKKNIK